jgi:hypothetical protein
MNPICQCCGVEVEDESISYCEACAGNNQAWIDAIAIRNVALYDLGQEVIHLQEENIRLRILLDIAHAAHHQGIDHCPRCERVAEAGCQVA